MDTNTLTADTSTPHTSSSGNLWLAIFITVVASTACSIGKALQKEATRHLPKLSSDNKILRQYLANRVWLTGVAADVGGGIIQIAAFALAPVSIVQPISSIGLVGLALYSHFILRERLSMFEWWAVALAMLGTLGLGASSSADTGGGATVGASAGAFRMIFTLFLTGGMVQYLSTLRDRQRQRHRKATSASGGSSTVADKGSIALYGLQAGGCFGLSAATCRVGFLLAQQRAWLWAVFGLLGSISLSSFGFIVQTTGLKEGSAVVIVTCVAVASMAVGIFVGLVGIGEPMPTTVLSFVVRLISSLCILFGVVGLAGGQSGTREIVSVALSYIPAHVWNKLPVNVAVKVKSWAGKTEHLPMAHHSHQHAGHGGNNGDGSTN